MEERRKGFLTLERAKSLADLLTINFCEDLNPDVEYETPELEEKIKNYVEAKKELEEFLELDR